MWKHGLLTFYIFKGENAAIKELRTITAEELKDILKEHEKWLTTGHKEGTRADLRRANLQGSNLNDADLREACLFDADLTETCLIGADLTETCLIGADLRSADLRRADLRRADLYGANLRNADLSDANLNEARLESANLINANLFGSILMNTDLCKANLDGAKYFVPAVCPTEGPFIAWKKAGSMVRDFCEIPEHKDAIILNVIIKLLIPEDALRSSGTGRKCRASKAVVLDIQSLGGESLKDKDVVAYSSYKDNFVYKIGETVTPDSFDKNRFNECSNGIHFFIDRQEAVNYLI